MSKTSARKSRNLLHFAIIFALACLIISAATWTTTSSSALGLISESTPTHARSFAYAEIAKISYTASPTNTTAPLPTDTPVATPTLLPTSTIPPTIESTESTAYAEIIADTPTLEYIAPIVQESNEITAFVNNGNKYILVDISEQHMYVYEGDVLVYSFVSSTGMNNATRVGTFSVLNKIPNAYGATWNIWMPNWLGIYWSGNLQNGIHALPILPNGATLWEGYLGVPISYGCVVLGTYEAQILYDWADVGTSVEIQW